MSDTTSDPGRIERDLDQTRARLGSHLTELQSRLSPGQVLDDLMRYFRGSEGADFGRSLANSVRANPLPAALTGIGLTWLMATSPRRSTPGSPTDTGGGRVYESDLAIRARTAAQGVVRKDGEAEQAYTSRLDDARGQAIGLQRQAQESAGSFGQRIRDAVTGAGQTVAAGAHDLRDQVGEAMSTLGSTAQGAVQSASGTVHGATERAGRMLTRGGQTASQTSGSLITALTENPVLLGALGLAAGALFGALLPQSDQEEAALGSIAGQARDVARDVAQKAVDKGSDVAHAVVDAGRDSAQTQGLAEGQTPGRLVDAALSGELAGNLKQVAADVLQTGDDAIRKAVPGQVENSQRPV